MATKAAVVMEDGTLVVLQGERKISARPYRDLAGIHLNYDQDLLFWSRPTKGELMGFHPFDHKGREHFKVQDRTTIRKMEPLPIEYPSFLSPQDLLRFEALLALDD